MRTTPDHITKLEPNEVFVFGSNLAGIHGAGAALMARQRFGAIQYDGVGLSGQSYAIPTKDYGIKTLPLSEIERFVRSFIAFANRHQDLTFLLTEIGCGLAGYKPEQIAPMFKAAPKNVILPKRFHDVLEKENE